MMPTSTPLCHVHQDYGIDPYLLKFLRLQQLTPSLNYYYYVIIILIVSKLLTVYNLPLRSFTVLINS